jgi:two-component system cell cycle sensor histidine kinase/response regulator CckA
MGYWEVRKIRSDGSVMWARDNVRVVVASNDDLVALVVCEDITERVEFDRREKEMQEQLASAERMESLAVLSGGVAHDLNNVLGPLVALPELIREDIESLVDDGESAKKDVLESIDMIKQSAGRASVVVRDLVALSRRAQYSRIPSDVNELASLQSGSACVTDLKKTCRGVIFQHKRFKGRLVVMAETDHLDRAVDNLIRNAAEAIKGEGVVTISTRRETLNETYHGYTVVPPGEYAVIEISDTGQGIGAAYQHRIFEPFFTRKSKSDRSGSGLGLSVVHGVVADHDGFIDVDSTAGKGTAFTLYFPLAGDMDALQAEIELEPVARGTEAVLVVDDEPGQRFIAKKSLSKLGYNVDEAASGREAVRLFEKARDNEEPSPSDLVLLDMIMEEGFDGLDTLTEILKMYPEQKVIIVSGHAENERAQLAKDLGADWFAKPYDVADLASALRMKLDA